MLLQDPTTPSMPVTAIIARLLDRAGDAIGHDQDRARLYLARAAALLEADRAAPPPAIPAVPAPPPPRGQLAPWQLQRVTRHIEAHLDSPLRVAQLAALARLSPHYFCRAFRASLGHSPYAYILQRRIQRAQDMMLAGNEPLSQIALACGMADQAHFSRLFRNLVGVSPHAWRRSRRAMA